MNKVTYEKAKLVITQFDHDGIYTDTLVGSAPVRSNNMLPIISLGSPIAGVGGSDITGTRDSFGGYSQP